MLAASWIGGLLIVPLFVCVWYGIRGVLWCVRWVLEAFGLIT
jgi:hypothetical protein